MTLLPINTIISHGSALIFPEKKAYLFIGYNGIPSIIGIILQFLGIVLIHTHFLKDTDTTKSWLKHKNLYYIVGIISILYLGGMLLWIFPSIEFNTTTYRIISIGFIVLYSAFMIYKLVTQQSTNSIILKRYILVGFHYSLWTILNGALLLFVPSQNTHPSDYLTRLPTVEIYLLLLDLLAIFSAFMVYLLITLPYFVRTLLNISPSEFLHFNIDPVDSAHETIKYVNMEDSSQSSDPLDVDVFSERYLIFTDLPENPTTLRLIETIGQITEFYDTVSLESIYDEYWNIYVSKKFNILVLNDQPSDVLDDIFDEIEKNYDIKLDFDGTTVLFDNYRYKEPDKDFAMISIVNSIWATRYRMWVTVFPSNCTSVVYDFLDKYIQFLDFLSMTEMITIILKFDLDEYGNPVNIPPLPNNPSIPHTDNVILFH